MKKIVYWKIEETLIHSFRISFWTKPDRSNSLTTVMVVLDNDKLRAKITHITGQTVFELVQVKGK